MATPPPLPIQWIPEDDLLLKNAVEAGASLEALAKGAVQFSRRFTFRELRDRWHSLLYDPDISAQASAAIFELEISGINPASKLIRSDNTLTGNKEISKKRKSESIRKKYYAMRKKFRSEFFNNTDLGFFESNPHEFSGNGADFQKQDHGMSDHLGLQEEDLDILRHAFPETIMDIALASDRTVGNYGYGENVSKPLTEGGNNMLEVDVENRKSPVFLKNSSINETPHSSSVGFEGRQQFNSPNSDGFASLFASDDMFQDTARVSGDMLRDDVECKENRSVVYTSEFADPDSLLNLSNDEEILLTDVDEKNADNKSCPHNKINSVLLQDSRKDDQDNDVAKIHGNQQKNLEQVVNEPSKPIANSDIAEISGEGIICTLNTEDPEIPCNDDIFLLIHPSTSFGSSSTQRDATVSVDASAAAHEKDNEKAVNLLTKPKDSTKVGMELHSAKMEMHDSRPQTMLPGFANKPFGDSGKGKSFYAIPKILGNRLVQKEVGVSKVANGPTAATGIIRLPEGGSGRLALQEPAVESSESDQEESHIDDDVPYFSDVEAMILEMDLDPYDQDSHVIKQVSSYQYDDTKRTIIRLEEGARSFLHRAMTSQNALAILYGRHIRHYITKPEILLGRSTDDFDVDIDLRKEGRANKISRRQAIIKMEADGSFFLKNLGKSSVSVNGTTVATGQLLNLSSGCLIEIKGMSFVFEINQEYVRKNLGNFCLKNKGKTGKSDWSGKDEP
ncbi:hypothetical protein BUALT_Bualt04G0008000 [Buddleja alternifolia]|uniref:FHA domain-containing protein n=1 Tax=Buddleja alternifolia TaxID=168488 RepID=A0AAV6XVY6_9LAMI|nr:hypothetical protein BUALT_Bualt04G0008000 [Buddleja alternifolia]